MEVPAEAVVVEVHQEEVAVDLKSIRQITVSAIRSLLTTMSKSMNYHSRQNQILQR